MSIEKEEKAQIISDYALHQKDVGSPEVQVAILTRRIKELSLHTEKSPKDNHSRRGLVSLVARRRRLLNYIRKIKPETYPDLIQKLGLRK
ncbi:MAG: 30S ribosomal protein S15 [Candidatus Dadabacteria bacterium RIFCSPHIGHO2_12_FULL_53_21]|jgi:small subunit ribosomal protein S15|nr:MAG: 30S ribosomal protein S15 [Candidatus Dadabacteria bacterium RIFCSPHIGHO2_12_FULL_53_21]